MAKLRSTSSGPRKAKYRKKVLVTHEQIAVAGGKVSSQAKGAHNANLPICQFGDHARFPRSHFSPSPGVDKGGIGELESSLMGQDIGCR